MGVNPGALRVYSNAVVETDSNLFSPPTRTGGRIVVAACDLEEIMLAKTDGEVIAEYAWAPEHTLYVAISRSLIRFRTGVFPIELFPTC
ncbi:MAG: hypothetical protein NVSMB43_24400 [Pseudarthrobacter sp.]